MTMGYRMGEFEAHALRCVDLDVSPGEFVVLPGAACAAPSCAAHR